MTTLRRITFIVLLRVVVGAVATIFTRDRNQPLVLIGVIDANDIVVTPRVQGRLDSLWVEEGSDVTAGQLVASLESSELAVMSIAVSRRTRELGVCVALVASPARIVKAVFKQPLRQLGMGLLASTVLVGALQGGTDNGWPTATQLLTLGAHTTLMTVVFLIACVVPIRRALAVQPSEAMRHY